MCVWRASVNRQDSSLNRLRSMTASDLGPRGRPDSFTVGRFASRARLADGAHYVFFVYGWSVSGTQEGDRLPPVAPLTLEVWPQNGACAACQTDASVLKVSSRCSGCALTHCACDSSASADASRLLVRFEAEV